MEVPMPECLSSFLLVEHLFDQAFDPPTGGWTYDRIATVHRKLNRTRDGYICVMPYSDQNWRDFFEVARAPQSLANDPGFGSVAFAMSIGSVWQIVRFHPISQKSLKMISRETWGLPCSPPPQGVIRVE